MRLRSCLLLLLLGLPPRAAGESEAVVSGLRIGRIIITRSDVFGDDQAQRWPYSWGNSLHITTSERYVRSHLLFKEGQLFDPNLIVESERLLRSRPIFRFVTITPQEAADGVVDVMVRTEDVWTTSIQMAYGAAGGVNTYRLGVLEHNFLGKGRTVGAFIRQDIDRYVKGFSYQDDRVGGRRAQLFGGYGRDEKGKEWQAQLLNPYDWVMRRHSEGVAVAMSDDEDRLFEGGDEVALFRHEIKEYRAFVSGSIDPTTNRTHRVSLAHERREETFDDFRFTRLREAPRDRTVSAIVTGYNFTRYRYIKERGLTTFDRVEDTNLGWNWSATAGPSLEDLGATRDGAIGRMEIRKAWRPDEGKLLFWVVEGKSRYEEGGLRDALLKSQLQWLAPRYWKENTFSIRGETAQGRNLSGENQVLLGGENGLRGYSVRQFSGNKKVLFGLENRQVLVYDWLKLVSLGWAVFADSGGVWDKGQSFSFNEFKHDVGVGLRFAPSRSFDPTIIRADVAYALNDNDRSSRVVFNVGGDLTLRFGDTRTKKFEQ